MLGPALVGREELGFAFEDEAVGLSMNEQGDVEGFEAGQDALGFAEAGDPAAGVGGDAVGVEFDAEEVGAGGDQLGLGVVAEEEHHERLEDFVVGGGEDFAPVGQESLQGVHRGEGIGHGDGSGEGGGGGGHDVAEHFPLAEVDVHIEGRLQFDLHQGTLLEIGG